MNSHNAIIGLAMTYLTSCWSLVEKAFCQCIIIDKQLLRRKFSMDGIREEINDLYNKGDWKTALEIQTNSDQEYNKVLWIRPEKQDLEFIYNAIKSRNLQFLISVGCGSGFFEWLLQSATGLTVFGIEVDRNWWESSYIKLYLPLIYQEDKKCNEILMNENAAIMFCYFNNESAFIDYIDRFKGDCLIIIGPKKNRHTNPHPFHPIFRNDEWTLNSYKQIKDSNDYIVIYEKLKT